MENRRSPLRHDPPQPFHAGPDTSDDRWAIEFFPPPPPPPAAVRPPFIDAAVDLLFAAAVADFTPPPDFRR